MSKILLTIYLYHFAWFRSNVLGTKFTVYDGGENPEKKPFIKESESVREELAAICYVSPSLPTQTNTCSDDK